MKKLNNRNLYEIEKERKIRDYILSNNFVPTKQTINFNLNLDLNSSEFIDSDKFIYGNSIRKEYSSANDFFFAKEISSANKFNTIVDTIKNDLICLYNRAVDLDDEIENSFRNFSNKSSKFIDEYKRLELEVNRELISNTNGENFTFGITEYFNNEENVIKSESNAFILDGKVMCRAKKYSVDKQNNYIINTSSRLRNKTGAAGSDINSPNHILKQDGSYYEHVVYTKNQFEIVDFIIDIDLNSALGIDVKVLRLDILNSGGNTLGAIYTSTEIENWEPSFEGFSVLNNGTNLFTINKTKVKYIKLVLTRDAPTSYSDSNYVYSFAIDYFGLLDVEYELGDSTIVCGPYKIFDENNNPVNFSYATIKSGTCCTIPDETSIEFYLSKDKINWEHLSFWEQTNSVVSFGENVSNLFSLMDETSNRFLINSRSVLSQFNLSCLNNEAILNFYIPNDNILNYKKNSAVIKRATRRSKNGGWFVNDRKATCHFFVNNFDGIYVQFYESVIIDNKKVSGKQFLKYGEHKIEISNYKKLTDIEIRENKDEKSVDTLLLNSTSRFCIEGYPYPSSFVGSKKYLGVNDNYGCIMKNTDPVYFVNNKIDKTIYTEIEIPGIGIFFKVNISESDSNWIDETFSINALSLSNISDNKLYIKAILSTKNPNISPKIDLIQVRVI